MGRPAAFCVAHATLEGGVKIGLKAWTLRSGETVYDFVLWSPAESFEDEVQLLDEFMRGVGLPPDDVEPEAPE